jgi:hypothetical protein
MEYALISSFGTLTSYLKIWTIPHIIWKEVSIIWSYIRLLGWCLIFIFTFGLTLSIGLYWGAESRQANKNPPLLIVHCLTSKVLKKMKSSFLHVSRKVGDLTITLHFYSYNKQKPSNSSLDTSSINFKSDTNYSE